MRAAGRLFGILAIALSGLLVLAAAVLASYDHQGDSPLGTVGRLLQLAVACNAAALAIWGHLQHKPIGTALSFALVLSWVPVVVAFGD